MKILNLFLALAIMAHSYVVMSSEACTACELTGLPTSSLRSIEKLAKNDVIKNKNKSINRSVSQIFDDPNWSAFRAFCIKFDTSIKENLALTIREMEQSKIPTDQYFFHSECRPSQYSDSITSPMIHYVAESPYGKQDFLNTIWLYYSKKRKEPEIFTKAINIKNSKGETLLDYIETLSTRNFYDEEAKAGPLKKIIQTLCEHGGIYAAYKDKSCSKP